MKKSDLKTGMVVETNNGYRFLVLLDAERKERNLIDFSGGWMDLTDYEEDLTHSNNPWSIKKVYSVGTSICHIVSNKDIAMANAHILWEREEIVEMTVAEIEKKLGIKNLKIVKE